MKKVAKVLGVVAIAVCMCFALAACKNEKGVYEGSTTVGEGEYAATLTMSIELKDDGKCVMKSSVKVGDDVDDSDEIEGTYKIDGKKIKITVEDEEQEFDFDKGKSITVTRGEGEEAVTIVLKKK